MVHPSKRIEEIDKPDAERTVGDRLAFDIRVA
jgi:hypothetical protein